MLTRLGIHRLRLGSVTVMAVLTAGWIVSGCASTRLERSWTSPYAGPTTFRNLVTIAITKDAPRRQAMEEAMASEIEEVALGVEAEPSRTILSDSEIIDEQRVRDHLAQTNYDGAIVMRVTDVTRQDVFVPGRTTVVPVYYRTFWGYYRHWAPIAFEPGYVERNQNVQVETQVYVMPTGDIVYSAVSRTLNPSSSADLMESVASVVAKDLKAKGFLASGLTR